MERLLAGRAIITKADGLDPVLYNGRPAAPLAPSPEDRPTLARSMTAFARVASTTPRGEFTWEVRSVNHRYLEQSLRLPETLREFEPRFRRCISERINRGKLDATLRYQPVASEQEFNVDAEVVRRLAAALHDVNTELGVVHTASPSSLDILRWPGVISGTPDAQSEELFADATATLEATLDKLVSAREAEGDGLTRVLEERVAQLRHHRAAVATRLPQVIQELREKLRTRLAEFLDKLEPDRLEQEIVLAAQKMDVAEELDRLGIHLDEIANTLKSQEPIGRRLDFLIQELNRETNTIASKSADAVVTQTAVEMKVLVEQMREQVQNLE